MDNPLKICCIKLDYLYFAPYLNMISVTDSMYLNFCQPISWIKVQELKGNFYPKNKQSWLEFSQKTKEFMCKEFDLRPYDGSMSNKKEFDKIASPIKWKY